MESVSAVTIPEALLGAVMFAIWLLMVIAIFRIDTKASDLPRGIPAVFVPAAYFLVAVKRLWRRQRIAAFLKLAHYLRMRQKRVDGLLPPWSRR